MEGRIVRSSALAALLVGMFVAGCGKGGGGTSSAPAPGATPDTSQPAAATSSYDAGPRAGEQPVDAAQAKTGEVLFTAKGCVACHGFGRRITCPDLNPVPMQRTAAWMEQQILHPEVMTRQDPIARALLAEYKLQMPNQKLTPIEARAVIEFIKKKTAGGGAAAK
jgi:cytochrome c551/c552